MSTTEIREHLGIRVYIGTMASVFSIGVSKLNPTAFFTRLCKVANNHNATQVAFMKRLALKDPVKKAPSLKYWEKWIDPSKIIFSKHILRYDENTRVIVVDGPPAVGKTKVCEKLAKEFGLLYMPAPTHDELFTIHGYDLRVLDSKLPLHAQSYDLERFLANPNDVRVPFFQITYLHMRFEQYANALLHVLSTGQGVVLNRCVYSDIAFMEAMLKSNYVGKEVMSEYLYMKNEACAQLLRPHMIIYLDVSPELVKENIKKRGNPSEVNSKIFTTKFLSDLEDAYKEKYLKPLKDHSELLIYDWSNEKDLMDVVYDVEQADLDTFKEPKLKDWIFTNTMEVNQAIQLFQYKWPIITSMYQNETFPPRECYWTADEYEELIEQLDTLPIGKYNHSCIPTIHNVLFAKENHIKLNPFRISPRDFVNLDKTVL